MLASSGIAAAQPAGAAPAPVSKAAQAEQHVETAKAYFAQGNFEGALAEYRTAQELDPRPDHLYAMGKIEEVRGGCAAAIELYDQFLATSPPEEDAAVVRESIAACKKQLGTDSTTTAPLDPVPPPARPERKPFYTDVLGDVLVVGGIVGLATGGAFYGLALSDLDAAEKPGITVERYDELRARAEDRQLYAIISASVGGALVIGGVVRFLTRDSGDEATSVALHPIAGGGAGVTFGGRF